MDTHTPDREVNDITIGSTTGRRTNRSANKIEIITRDARRDWPPELKRSIVMESFTGELTPSELARKHAISTGQLYTWRREFLAAYASQAGQPITQFARVDVATTPPAKRAALPGTCQPPSRQQKGVIEIALANGATIRVDSQVDAGALRLVLDALDNR
jgi:transposase